MKLNAICVNLWSVTRNPGFRSLLLGLYLMSPVCALAQPSWEGAWTGMLNHQGCVPISSLLKVSVFLQPQGGGVTGEVRYYMPQQDTIAYPNQPLFAFPLSGRIGNNTITLKYHAHQELHGNQFGMGYYIQGGYSLMLELDSNADGQKLAGQYAGSNGGRGVITLKRPKYFDAKDDGKLIATLRERQKQRKSIQQPVAKVPAHVPDKPVASASPIDTPSHALPLQQGTTDIPAWLVQNDSLRRLFIQEKTTVNFKKARQDSLHTTWDIPAGEAFIDINLYDNAEIDGDSISLFVDDVLVLHRVALSAKPVVFRLHRPDNGATSTKLTMVAENLGAIPPNTALLQASIGGELRRVNMVASLTYHGTIICLW